MLQGAEQAKHFTAASSRLLETRSSQSHNEGGYAGLLSVEVDEHEVVNKESTKLLEDRLFSNVAVKDQLRQHQAAVLDEAVTVQGLERGDDDDRQSPGGHKEKAIWALKMEASRVVRTASTRMQDLLSDVQGEVAARTIEFEELYLEIEQGMEVRDQFHKEKGSVDDLILEFKEEVDKKAMVISKLQIESLQNRDQIAKVIRDYKKDDETFTAKFKEVRGALKTLRQLCQDLERNIAKMDQAGRSKHGKR